MLVQMHSQSLVAAMCHAEERKLLEQRGQYMSSKASNIVKEEKKLNSSAICWLRKVTKLRRLTRAVSKNKDAIAFRRLLDFAK